MLWLRYFRFTRPWPAEVYWNITSIISTLRLFPYYGVKIPERFYNDSLSSSCQVCHREVPDEENENKILFGTQAQRWWYLLTVCVKHCILDGTCSKYQMVLPGFSTSASWGVKVLLQFKYKIQNIQHKYSMNAVIQKYKRSLNRST